MDVIPIWSIEDVTSNGLFYCQRCYKVVIDGGALLLLARQSSGHTLSKAWGPGSWIGLTSSGYHSRWVTHHNDPDDDCPWEAD